MGKYLSRLIMPSLMRDKSPIRAVSFTNKKKPQKFILSPVSKYRCKLPYYEERILTVNLKQLLVYSTKKLL